MRPKCKFLTWFFHLFPSASGSGGVDADAAILLVSEKRIAFIDWARAAMRRGLGWRGGQSAPSPLRVSAEEGGRRVSGVASLRSARPNARWGCEMRTDGRADVTLPAVFSSLHLRFRGQEPTGSGANEESGSDWKLLFVELQCAPAASKASIFIGFICQL